MLYSIKAHGISFNENDVSDSFSYIVGYDITGDVLSTRIINGSSI
jgi:hypothetical protein